MIQMIIDNLDKLHTILIKSSIWWGIIIPAIVLSGFNFYYMLVEIIKGMPCLSGDEDFQDSWGALKIVYIIFLIFTVPFSIILQVIFPNGIHEAGDLVLGRFGYYIVPSIEETKIYSLILLSIILLSIVLTIVFKILIYYKTKKDKES